MSIFFPFVMQMYGEADTREKTFTKWTWQWVIYEYSSILVKNMIFSPGLYQETQIETRTAFDVKEWQEGWDGDMMEAF